MKVEGRSMEPTFYSGDCIIARKYILKPKEGDIVILKHPEKDMKIVKRIVKIDKDGYFIEGDNKTESSDSRKFGLVKRNMIIAKVICRIK
jgi:nickel-type superoxide dismutase maturation protease